MIQETMLALCTYVRNVKPWQKDVIDDHLFDDLIAAAFSLWRAVFLMDRPRTDESVREAQEKFLQKVLVTNSIAFGDDFVSSEWSVSYYLENAKHRIDVGTALAYEYTKNDEDPIDREAIGRLIHLKADQVSHLRYQWECAHKALRMLFNSLVPTQSLPVPRPKLPTE